MAVLESRYWGCNPNYENCSSRWGNWGRWVLLAAVILFAFVLFFSWAFYSNRRRRRMGMRPLRGTGWTGRNVRPTPQYQQPYYNPNGPAHNPNAPAYPPPPQYQGPSPEYMHQNPSYYGQQQQGVELQQPPNAYQGGENVYSPPPGPPPAK